MKYSKEWRRLLNQMPPNFQDVCLDYKKWKTHCKNLNTNEALVLLSSECSKVDDTFNSSYKIWNHPPSILTCFIRPLPLTSANTLLLFAQANAKTVYKICKRLQKTSKDPTPMAWLTSIRAAHEFNFLGGHHTTHLQLCDYGDSIECPICLTMVRKKHMLIYQCGHNACIQCTLQYAQVKEKGLWYHTLPYAHRKDCLYCHFEKAFVNATTV